MSNYKHPLERKQKEKAMANRAQYLNFINYEPTERPAWQKLLSKCEDDLTTSNMVKKIVEYRRQFLEFKRKKKLPKDFFKDIDLDFLIKFLFNIQVDEGIGLQNEDATKKIISNLSEDWPDINMQKMLEKLDTYEIKVWERQSSSDSSGKDSSGSGSNAYGKRGRQISWESCNSDGSNSSMDEDGGKRLKLDQPFDDFTPPNYPSIGDTESVIKLYHETMSKDQELCKQLDETINLYKGYKHIAEEICKLDKQDRPSCLGLIDMDAFVIGLHKLLMNGVMDDAKTKPGQFSINERNATYKSQLHTYPRFATEELAYTAIQTLVDKYADILDEIKKIPDKPVNEEKKIEYFFKCASLFLFAFTELHPFGDGNGRLARLLCSYSLLTFSPFMSPIFNVFSPSDESDYTDALKKAGQGLQLPEIIATEQEAKAVAFKVLGQKPSDLCSLLIESNYFMWREYLRRIHDKSQ